MKDRQIPQSGLTLLELLLALSIFSFMMAFVVNSFFQFHQQNDRVNAIFELRREARILEKLMREDIGSVVYLSQFMLPGEGGYQDERKSGVLGEEDRIYMHVRSRSKFYRTLSIEQDPEVHEVAYFIENQGTDDTPALMRREQFFIDPDITDGDNSISHVLSENVTSLKFRYFAENQSIEDGEDTWDSTDETRIGKEIPVGIEVSLVLKNKVGDDYTTVFQINTRPDMGESVKWRF